MADRVLVTGAAGFVGSHLVRRLVREGLDVVAIVRPTSDLWRLADVLDSVELVRAELTALPSVRSANAVYHLAAAGVRPGSPRHEVVETNVLGTLAALELANGAQAAHFLYCGSCFEYGPGERHREAELPRPISDYGAAKAAGWLFAEAHGRSHQLHVVSVRPFTVYGPYEARYRLVPAVALGAVRGEPVELTGGAQTRDFVYVDDAVDAIAAAMVHPEAGTFNICTGTSTAVRDLAEQLAALAGGVELRFGALPSRAVEFETLSGDPTLAAEALGWTASTPIVEGLRRTLEWFREHHADAPYLREPAVR